MITNINLLNRILIIVLSFSVLILFTGQVRAESERSNKETVQKSPEKKEKTAVVGSVDSISGDQLTVEDKRKEKTKAIIDKNTKIMRADKKQLNLNNIKKNDKVALISSSSATISGQPKKILKVFVKEATISSQMRKKGVHGVVTDIEGSVLTISHQIHQDRIYKIKIDANTVIKSQEGSSSASLKLGARLSAVGEIGADNILLAKMLHVIPGKAAGVFNKNPISAKPSASSSAQPLSPVISPSPTN